MIRYKTDSRFSHPIAIEIERRADYDPPWIKAWLTAKLIIYMASAIYLVTRFL